MAFSIGKSSSDDTSSSGFKMEAEGKQVHLGSGTVIEASFSFEGPTFINCKLIGNIIGKTSVAVGPEGEIAGNIMAQEVTVAGRVSGDIEASSKVGLKKPAVMNGNVRSPKVSVEDGVVFNGQVMMKSPAETLGTGSTH